MLAAMTTAILSAAALLFLVQPMVGKVLLPMVGGSPAVWNTCMVFFQAVLLLGYGYAHVLSKLRPAAQVAVHAGLLVAAALLLPIPTAIGAPERFDPIPWLLGTLAATAGVPFFAVSTSGPLLQRWFSRTDHPRAGDPYFLYGASNAGSVAGLLLYPFVVEPTLTRSEQSLAWAWAFRGVAALVIVCGVLVARRARAVAHGAGGDADDGAGGGPGEPAVGWSRRGRWLLLSAVPSSLLLGVTQYIATDVASVPLMWMLPLLIYLGSFMVAFASGVRIGAARWGRYVPVGVVAAGLIYLGGLREPIAVVLLVHLVTFALAAMLCHRSLYEDRPGPGRLTEFYLWIAVGGVLGGSLNALAAPALFDRVLEYPLVLGLACFLRPEARAAPGIGGWQRWGVPGLCGLGMIGLLVASDALVDPGIDKTGATILRGGVPAVACAALLLGEGSRRFACAAMVMLVGAQFTRAGAEIVHQERTFFGVHQVRRIYGVDPVTKRPIPQMHSLVHGTTSHGQQFIDNPNRPRYRPSYMPTTYYHERGPIGQVFATMAGEKRLGAVGVIGLGTGTLAAYGLPGMQMEFIEIDPAVKRIATDPRLFLYLSQSRARVAVHEGDGRLLMRNVDGPAFDLIVVDAFSSDAIPVHLITREAVALYVSKLRSGGMVAFHISSRHFRLGPVLKRIADAESLAFRLRDDEVMTKQDQAEAKMESVWVVLGRTAKDFGAIADDKGWTDPPAPRGTPLWTDEYSNIMSAFVGWGAH